MQNLIPLDAFSNLTNIKEEEIDESLVSSECEGKYLAPQDAINLFLQKIGNQLLAIDMNANILEPIFLEKTIQILTSLYESLLKERTESSQASSEENTLLKDTLITLQEECQNYQSQIQDLQDKVRAQEEEIQFLQKKHQLMWGKVSNISNWKE